MIEDIVVLLRRSGQVLSENTLLKLDYYLDRSILKHLSTLSSTSTSTSSSSSSEELLIQQDDEDDLYLGNSRVRVTRVSGAQNFRQASNPVFNSRIYGVAQPTVSGVRTVLNHLDAKEHHVTWINLREEPLIYINSRPFVLREKDRPYQNLPYYTGISLDRLEDMEVRLKQEILDESRNFKDNILIHEEIGILSEENTGLVSGYWESICSSDLQTPKEMYCDLRKEGYNVTYYRVPITAEQDLSLSDYDKIISVLKNIDPNSKIVFNCQLGKTRSTHSMIVAWLYDLLSNETNIQQALQFEAKRNDLLLRKSEELLKQYDRGDYKPVQDLLRILIYGLDSKDITDLAIDSCGLIRNLRDVISMYKNKADKSRSIENRELFLSRGFRNLSRYYHLISVCDYLRFVLTNSSSSSEWISYCRYIEDRSEQINIIKSYTTDVALTRPKTIDDSDVIYKRNGQVLSKSAILKSDHFFNPLKEFNENCIDGTPNYRSLKTDGLLLHGSATPNVKGFINVLQTIGAKSKIVHIVNLREEAVLYINGSPYNLRDIDFPFTNMNLEGISAERLQQIEQNLKNDCLNELHKNGKLLLHDETTNAELVSLWEECKDGSAIQTTQQIMDTLQNTMGYKIRYKQVPITPLLAPELRDFDEIVSLMIEAKQNAEEVYFFDHFGLGRTYIGLVIASLFTLVDSKRIDQVKLDIVSPPYLPVSILMRLLPDSRRRQAEVHYALEQCKMGAEMLDILKEIESNITKSKTARTTTVADLYRKKAARILKKYLLTIAFAGYLHDQKPLGYTTTFSTWIQERAELAQLFLEIDEKPNHALQIDSSIIELESIQGEQVTRSGEVLGVNTVLKNDHFPGCQRMNMKVMIEGAPNFRKIENEALYGKVYGVAIPTVTGIENVLHYLDAKKNQILWINLREEPLVYIGNCPYTLREQDRPFANIEITGIVTERLVLMEQRLQRDILAEAALSGGKILVHDENENSESFNHYLPATTDTIRRLNEIYDSMRQKGYKVQMERVPITDESAPEPSDFDAILKAVVATDPHTTYYVCNCQQGRGRTTTCIVVYCLINTWRLNSKMLDQDLHTQDVTATSPPDETENLRNGNYKVVQLLMRVMRFGKKNKKQVDSVLDDCSHMQNLRTAILGQKLQAVPDGPNNTMTQKNIFAYERGVKYLERYLYLIIFNEYLHEEMVENTSNPFERTFEQWLNSRAEILNILKAPITLD
jgi:protein-tyrosine phosphatase